MMNIKKELINTFKGLMGVYFGKVYNDSELKISNKSVGGKVENIDSNGTLTPVEDGEYVMDDGFGFTVVNGVITSIVGEEDMVGTTGSTKCDVTGNTINPSEETPAEEATETPTEEAVEDSEMECRIQALEEKVDSLMALIQTMEKQKMESAEAIEKFSLQVKQLNDNIQILVKVPVEFSKTNKTLQVEESKQEKLMSIATMIGSINKK